MAATAWDMVHPPSKPKAAAAGFSDIPLSRATTAHSGYTAHGDTPLLPPGVNQKLGERFAGIQKGIGAFGFGKQAGAASGAKISRPMETLPSKS
jgi:hypothetical protein